MTPRDGYTPSGWNVCIYALHLHGRLLPKLLPRALPGRDAARFGEYVCFSGEGIAAFALGYNFGDGYLHGSPLLDEVQERCGFAEGECVQVFVDSCPLFGRAFPWWIRDATDAFAGAVGHGEADA